MFGVYNLEYMRKIFKIIIDKLKTYIKYNFKNNKTMNKVDIKKIISQENYLTDRANFDLGDVYFLCIDLLNNIQCIYSISCENEVSTFFDAQILKNFHLAVLNTIRRHTNIALLSMRQVLESISLFVFSMEKQKFSDYNIIKSANQIIEYDENIILDSYKYIESKYPEISIYLEVYKDTINYYYSHANILSSQYNSTVINNRIKVLIFDDYIDDYIRGVLLTLNELMILTLKIYKKLEKDYKIYSLDIGFEEELSKLIERHQKIKTDILNLNKSEKKDEYRIVDNIIKKKKEKYKDKLPDDFMF